MLPTIATNATMHARKQPMSPLSGRDNSPQDGTSTLASSIDDRKIAMSADDLGPYNHLHTGSMGRMTSTTNASSTRYGNTVDSRSTNSSRRKKYDITDQMYDNKSTDPEADDYLVSERKSLFSLNPFTHPSRPCHCSTNKRKARSVTLISSGVHQEEH
jgi:hypothetical protein